MTTDVEHQHQGEEPSGDTADLRVEVPGEDSRVLTLAKQETAELHLEPLLESADYETVDLRLEPLLPSEDFAVPVDQRATVGLPPKDEVATRGIGTLLKRGGGRLTAVGPYEILGELGRGGMGVVHRGRHRDSGDEVAIKLMLGTTRANNTATERFRRECQVQAKLNHPNIVALHGFGGTEGGPPYLAMDLIPGRSLQDRLDEDGPLSNESAAWIARKLTAALWYAHQHYVLHRDLKPDNVLLGRCARGGDDEEPLLTDFGLSRDLDPSLSGTQLSIQGRYMGSPGYWPPEQASGDIERVGPHSDVYALGGTLYAMLTGFPPHDGDDIMGLIEFVLHGQIVPPSSRVPSVDPELERICMRCLEKEPTDRYPFAHDLLFDLDTYLGMGRPEAKPSEEAPSAPGFRRPTPDRIEVSCPSCDEPVVVPVAWAGGSTRCRACRLYVRIPTEAGVFRQAPKAAADRPKTDRRKQTDRRKRTDRRKKETTRNVARPALSHEEVVSCADCRVTFPLGVTFCAHCGAVTQSEAVRWKDARNWRSDLAHWLVANRALIAALIAGLVVALLWVTYSRPG